MLKWVEPAQLQCNAQSADSDKMKTELRLCFIFSFDIQIDMHKIKATFLEKSHNYHT